MAVCTAFFSLQIQAQYKNLNFTHYNARNGLSSDHVDCVIQDHEGYIWIGTNQGVSVFDGLHFSTYHLDPNDPNSIGGNHILDIKEDSQGNIWLVIENFGLSRIDKERNHIQNFAIPVKEEVEERYINTISFERDGSLLVATERGLLVLNPADKKFHATDLSAGIKRPDVIGIENDREGNCWIFGYEGELFCRLKGQEKFEKIKSGIKTGYVNSVYHSTTNEFWISSATGLFKLVPSSKLTDVRFDLQKNIGVAKNPERIFIDDVGTYWLVDKKGKPSLYFPEKTLFQDLEDAWVSGLDLGFTAWKRGYIDKDKNLWMTTDRGVFMFNRKKSHIATYGEISKYNIRNANGAIYSMDHFNNDIVSITSKSLTVFDLSNNNIQYVVNSPLEGYEDLAFNCVQRIADHKWWVATNNGIWELVEDHEKFIFKPSWVSKTKNEFANKEVLWISRDQYDNFYISTVRDGLIYLDMKTKSFKAIVSAEKDGHKMSLKHVDFTEVAVDGSVAVRTHYGFVLARNGSMKFEPIQSFCDTVLDWSLIEITDLQELNGKWWISTQGNGLWSINPYSRQLKIYTEKDGLPSNYISSVLEEKGLLVLGTAGGLSIFDPVRLSSTNYFENDGLPSNQFAIRSRYKADDGEFFFSTSNGLISFYIDSLQRSRPKPLIKVSSVLLQGKMISRQMLSEFLNDHELAINYNESVNISFTPLTFSGVSDFVLRYRLDDQDTWRVSQSGLQISLDNLDPKQYHLSVQLIDKNGSNMSDTMHLVLDVIPPFYNTIWFRVFLLIFFSGIVSFFVILKTRQDRLKERRKMESINLLERERARIAMELHDDLGGNLTAISLMSNMLSEVQLGSRENELIKNLSSASEHMIDDMNEIVWALNPRNDELHHLIAYIRQYAQNLLGKVNVSLIFQDDTRNMKIALTSRVRRNIFMICKESLSNILKHSGASEVHFSFSIDNEIFKLEIFDNGTGISKPKAGKSTGNGFVNMKKRAEEIGGEFDFIIEKGHTVKFSTPLVNLMIKESD